MAGLTEQEQKILGKYTIFNTHELHEIRTVATRRIVAGIGVLSLGLGVDGLAVFKMAVASMKGLPVIPPSTHALADQEGSGVGGLAMLATGILMMRDGIQTRREISQVERLRRGQE